MKRLGSFQLIGIMVILVVFDLYYSITALRANYQN